MQLRKQLVPLYIALTVIPMFLLLIGPTPATASDIQFRDEELTERITVGYAVRLLDMNDDDQLDIVVLDSKRLLWLENPTWKTHVIYETPDAKFDNVCFAPHDIDGDGDLDFALGADWQFGNTRSGGTIGWLEQTTAPQWTYHAIATEPTTHRMQWMQVADGAPPVLVVAPLKGRNTTEPAFAESGVRLLAFSIPENPATDQWTSTVITDDLHVMHNIDVVDLDQDGWRELLTASFEGVHWVRPTGEAWKLNHIGTGDQERPAPKLGSSEIRLGRLANQQPVIATVEPWHGDRIVTYTPSGALDAPWQRHVIDANLAWGHAVAFADLDGDEDQELVIGVRDNLTDDHRCGVRVFDPVAPQQGQWTRLLVDPGGVAVEDLAVADLNSDGRPDIVAVGRKTQNIKIYWNETQQ